MDSDQESIINIATIASATPAGELKRFQKACALKHSPQKDDHIDILLQKGLGTADSESDMTTMAYLTNFRKRIGFEEPEEQEHVCIYDDDDEEEEDECEEDEECETDLEKQKYADVHLMAEIVDDPITLHEFWELTVVDISDNELHGVQNLGSLPYVEIVKAQRNFLEKFLEIDPPVPAALKELDFSYNLIHSIVNLEQYWSLTHINLSHNELESVHGFSGLEYLEELDLSYNRIVEIEELDCPNLITLNLSFNCFVSIAERFGCHNLRALNLNNNCGLSSIGGLKYLTQLQELDISECRIEEIRELEHLQPLMYLASLKVHPNPVTSMENWRLVVVHALPQIFVLDEIKVELTELRASDNLFNPSFEKDTYLDHADLLIDRTSQATNTIFGDYSKTRPFPPILLIVGPPNSHCHTLALLLKQRFRNKIHLGGVHSTATTIEGSNPKLDIPVSFECFKEMKRRGEFLSTCEILGRICGFASSQISRAAEKGALLVAAVPLKTALALREWHMHLNPKLVLALPSTLPQFPVDEKRSNTIRRSKQMDDNLLPLAADHVINFEPMLSVVPSLVEEKDPEKILYGSQSNPNPDPGLDHHSILKPVHFETPGSGFPDAPPPTAETRRTEDTDESEDEKRRVRVLSMKDPTVHEHHRKPVDLEKKQKKLKSHMVGPGMEKYHDHDDDLYDHPSGTLSADSMASLVAIYKEALGEWNGEDADGWDPDQQDLFSPQSPVKVKSGGRKKEPRCVPLGNVPKTPVFCHKPVDRLANLILNQPDEKRLSVLNISEILVTMGAPDAIDLSMLPRLHEEPEEEEEAEETEMNGEDCWSSRCSSSGSSGSKASESKKMRLAMKKAKEEEEKQAKTATKKKLDEMIRGLCNPFHFEWPPEVKEKDCVLVESLTGELETEEDEEEMEPEEEFEAEFPGEVPSSESIDSDTDDSNRKIRFGKDGKKIKKEPLHDSESEHVQKEAQHHRHKEAMTSSILETKERYFKFHADHPGFFHNVVDSGDLCSSYNILENIALETLIKHKEDAETSKETRWNDVKSYCDANPEDAKSFQADRMKKSKESTSLWSRGLSPNIATSESGRFKLKWDEGKKDEALFVKPPCPRNLLNPEIRKTSPSMKMKKLVELYEKRAKYSHIKNPTSSCSLISMSYLNCQ